MARREDTGRIAGIRVLKLLDKPVFALQAPTYEEMQGLYRYLFHALKGQS